MNNKEENILLYWSKMPSWTIDEAVVLGIGGNPDTFLSDSPNQANLSHYPAYKDLFRIVRRHVEAGSLSDPVKPADFVEWAKGIGIKLPDALQQVQIQNNASINWQEKYEILEKDSTVAIASLNEKLALLEEGLRGSTKEKELSTKERNTALTIIMAMAIGGYGYDINAKKNDAIADIESDIVKIGLQLDNDTIRRWLKNGAQIVPQIAE